MGAVVMEPLSKQQVRTQETRARLLEAAEEVFVKDGYEGAQLDQIAARAERSKGAVYGHFKSKEDLFLALFEHRMRTHIGQLMARLEKCRTRQEHMVAFREFYVGLANDRTWPVLTLEFKLFALRHPELKVRLRKAIEMARPPRDDADERRMFGMMTPAQKAENELALLALGPIFSGLILESHFESETLTEKALRRILGRIFDALFSESR